MTAALIAFAALQVGPAGWEEAPSLPRPVTNNAVVAVEDAPAGPTLYSFLGLDATRRWDGVVPWAFRWVVGSEAWEEIASVPGPGRLAATAQAVGGKIYLFGGYTVADDGSERSLASVDVYDPASGTWGLAAPMPVPVDDAVSGVWRDSLIYVVSGWHDDHNVADVQVYDPARDAWTSATPFPGTPVFGHAGAIARDAIVVIDGTAALDRTVVPEGTSRYRIERQAWRGDIDPADPTRIAWRRLEDHPGPPLYRSAGGAVGTRALFVGGTDNPYNYDGIGYGGRPSEPMAMAFAYDVNSDGWRHLRVPSQPSMDHRGLARAGGMLFLVGGMEARQTVTDRVRQVSLLSLLGG